MKEEGADRSLHILWCDDDSEAQKGLLQCVCVCFRLFCSYQTHKKARGAVCDVYVNSDIMNPCQYLTELTGVRTIAGMAMGMHVCTRKSPRVCVCVSTRRYLVSRVVAGHVALATVDTHVLVYDC